MTRKQLARLRRELASCGSGQTKAITFISLARRLGRNKENRGKEPTYVSCFADLTPLTIPKHGGKDLAPGTKKSILAVLEDDVLRWEDELDVNGEN